jgi:SAM-dependent methyltransferase
MVFYAAAVPGMRTFLPSGQPIQSSLEIWEKAYRRFETPDEEIRKFVKRLRGLGADHWPRSSRVVELFCGRGNGLLALSRLGFVDIEGIDLSPRLLALYKGPGKATVGDCRSLPWADGAKDILIVQGGLHHLPDLTDDLERVLTESQRVLAPGGKFVAIEPWLTPFLRGVHVASFSSLRTISGKLDAFATMVEHERETYQRWLTSADIICSLFKRYFRVEQFSLSWGKVRFVGINVRK